MMNGEMIEARVLQEKTRDLLDLLQRIQELPPDSPLPIDVVADFARQVGTIFVGGLVERRIFKARQDCQTVERRIFKARQDCRIPWPVDWYQEQDLKK
jgi:hypothetical protein